MNRKNIILLWVLLFLGFVFDLFSGSKTILNYGFIGFNLLVLFFVGIQSVLIKDKLIKMILICVSSLALLSAVGVFILGLILNIDSFGLGFIIYGLFTLAIASSLTTLVFVLVNPIILKKENYGKRDLIIFFYVLFFLLTHLIKVPNNTEVPFMTYLVSILVVCILLTLIEYLAIKFLKLSSQLILSFIILILIVISRLGFEVQVIFLLPIQIYLIVSLAINIYKSPQVKELLYNKNIKLGA